MRAIATYSPNAAASMPNYTVIASEAAARERIARNGRFRIECDDLAACRMILPHFGDATEVEIAIPSHASGLASAIFLVSIPKSGTHLYMNLLNALGFRQGGVLSDMIYQPGCWYFLRGSNAHTEAHRFFSDDVADGFHGLKDHPFQILPCLFGFRYPPSMLFSEARFYQKPESAVFSDYYAGLDLTGMLETLLRDRHLRGRFVDRTRAFLPYFKFKNVAPLSYEALMSARDRFSDAPAVNPVWMLQLRLAVPGNPSAIVERAFAQESATLDRANLIDPASREIDTRSIDPELDSLCQEFGYEPSYTDRAAPGSTKCLTAQTEPVALHFKRHSEIYEPVLIQRGYLGYNLIRYQNRILGIPPALGDVLLHLPEIPDQDISVQGYTIFVGAQVEDVKIKIFGTALMRQTNASGSA